MKTSISLPIFIFLLYTLLLSFTHCSVLAHKNTPFVDKICKQTPYHALCLKTLLSDPRSAVADVRGLAIIMVDVIKRDTVSILSRINELLKKGGTDPHTRGALLDCIDKYNAVLKGDVPEAMEALEKGDYKFAEQGATDASLEARDVVITYKLGCLFFFNELDLIT
ncbi:Cell wall / vacuolar inhibitor of fructosidase 1 [Vitis vinifera]|uniref:Cell wall / vacuolar inhibitor of fructosidase 1 n=1 Tax=Vitis vinifera TaxID=29760 RepID=A0A438CTE6_VITVI|nr:Cell wall / vacuolar inhibitor of fructosidase 1 [Vitis vinifera]